MRRARAWSLVVAGATAVTLGLGSTSAGAAAPAAPQLSTAPAATTPAQLPSRLQSRSSALVPTFGGRVLDAATGETIWSRGSTPGLIPASGTKILTAYTALATLGPTHRYTTSVHQSATCRTCVYLKGSGDPTLSSYRLRSLAASTATAVRAQGVTKVSLRFDDTLFPAPTNATGWDAGAVPTYVSPVRALVVDGRNSLDTSRQAAEVFASALRSQGVAVWLSGRARVPASARQLTSRRSLELRTIVATMLRESENDYAEALLWTSGIAAGATPSWAGVTGHSRRTVSRYGVPVAYARLYDGSGMSRSNRISAVTLATLAQRLYADPAYRPLVYGSTAMPVAGRTGTLADRFGTWPSRCAVGRVRAKTGSLRQVSLLAGVATGTDGRVRAFAFISNGREVTWSLRTRLDELAATTTLCM